MAKIAVIGLSSFGYYLAKKLSELGSEVLALDQDEEKIDAIKEFVTKAVVANATDREALRKLKLESMNWVVLSLGGRLESSILTAMHLKELGTANVVGKALSEDHAKILELMGVRRIVFPERDMGERLATSLHGANILDYLPLGSGLSIVEMIPQREMIGKTLQELHFRKRYHCQILAIKTEEGEEKTVIPNPDTLIEESHILILMGKDEDLSKIDKGKRG